LSRVSIFSFSAMASSVTRLTLVSLVSLALASCSSSQGAGGARSVPDLRRIESSLQDLRTLQAEHSAQLSSMESHVRQLGGRLEELEYRVAPGAVGAGSDRVSQHGIAQHGHNPASHSVSAHRPTHSGAVPPSYFDSDTGVGSGSVSPGGVGSLASPPPLVPAELLMRDEAMAAELPPETARLLRNALTRLREGAYREAMPFLEQALGLSYEMEWTANILFWIGVSFDGMADNPRALATYHDIVTQFPRHPRSAHALLRQASVFVRLNDVPTARLTLQKLVAEYSGTPEADQARDRLARLR
jgi:TolA-binding protein